MARVLITGGAGFIGSHLVERLLTDGENVVVLDNFSSGARANLPAHEPRLEVIEGDVRQLRKHAIRDVSTVFHLAALISGHDSLGSPDEYVDTNIGGLLRVIEFVREVGAKRIVFASSSTIYGNSARETRHEDDRPAPISMYALTKSAGEHMLAMYASLHKFEHTSLRLFNVYGPRQNPNHPYANVTCKFSHAAANGLPVKLYGDGKQTRDFVYVTDVVEALVRASRGTPRAVYNVGTGEDHSIAHLLAEVQRVSGTELRVDRLGEWPNDIRTIRADVARLQEDLGFRAATSLADGLAQTVQYFRSTRA